MKGPCSMYYLLHMETSKNIILEQPTILEVNTERKLVYTIIKKYTMHLLIQEKLL